MTAWYAGFRSGVNGIRWSWLLGELVQTSPIVMSSVKMPRM